MNKRILTFLVCFAAGLFFSQGRSRAQDITPPTDTAVSSDKTVNPAPPEVSGGQQPAVKAENKTPALENKYFRKKRAEPKAAANEVSAKEAAAKKDATPAEKKSFFSRLFSGKKKDDNKTAAQPVPAVVPAAPAVPVAIKEQQPKEQPVAVAAKQKSEKDWATSIRKSAMKIKGKAEHYIEESKDNYVRGRIDEAEASINQALAAEPSNVKAQTFKNKILLIKQKMSEAKRDFSEQCYFRGATYLQEGDVLDALLLVNEALKLNPQSEKARNLYSSVQQIIQGTANAMGKADGKKFKKGIDAFVNEDYDESIDIFRALQLYYPEIANYLGYANTHTADIGNKERSREYAQEAVKDVRNERYKKAQEDLFQALEMDRENMEAKVMMEQVNIELGLPSQPGGISKDIQPAQPPRQE